MAEDPVTRAVVLLSGGMDSAVCLRIASRRHGPGRVKALFFDWGQLALDEEQEAAFTICREAGISAPAVVRLDFPYGGNLTCRTTDIALGRTAEEILSGGISDTFFPGRNAVMLAYGYGTAAALGAGEVYFGANAQDRVGYPDCRPAFLEMISEALNAGLEGEIELVTPVAGMDKAQVVEAGDALGVRWESTFSCYAPADGGACGACDACVLRTRALEGR